MPRSIKQKFRNLNYKRSGADNDCQIITKRSRELIISHDNLDISERNYEEYLMTTNCSSAENTFAESGTISESSNLVEKISDDTIDVKLRKCRDSVLCFIGASCMSRSTDADFKRYLSSHSNRELTENATDIWKTHKKPMTIIYICDSCGKTFRIARECCGHIIKYIRTHVFAQITSLVQHYQDKIKDIRKKLRVGEAKFHNLSSQMLKQLWQMETSENELNLSLILSIDGVALDGNTKLKIWPVTLMMLDLPTADMQKISNMVLAGVAEGKVNPSTFFWNTVVKLLFSDVENKTGVTGTIKFNSSIVSVSADQPVARYVERLGDKTLEDSTSSRYGFGAVAPEIVKFVFPYDCIIDLLHNGPEGLLVTILTEAMIISKNPNVRSNLFANQSNLQSKKI
ncbi:hypothetical protein GCK72_003786 [Caenorhabditis remanei]|uniref:Uncharacterized protein n=1 Tax=Caenorhabditis remanei TaxID=31234 RepID=A0A6A5H7N0_CAERE|nr:hypothetical protein GCK72_003786 [Caenorhabditis remanei]KAF1763840.1 hypothetical protein GCK72_003786 [Caenorhabditis remanei]